MVAVSRHGLVLEKRSLSFEEEGVLNPAVILDSGKIHMFYRAVAKDNYSSIGYCILSDPLTIEYQSDVPVFVPENDFETHGVEDPRIVKIENDFYLSYTAFDGNNALGCVALSSDLNEFKRLGFVVPVWRGDRFRKAIQKFENLNIKYFQPDKGNHIIWDKNVVFFPRKINGQICFLHRIRPGIQIVKVNQLDDLTDIFWEDYMSNFDGHIVLDPIYKHELSYIGGGCPPIETPEGWLLIYHGVCDTVNGYSYSACAALLDLDNPQYEIGRLSYPLFEPEEEWEMKGYVNSVCFPTGSVQIEEKLYIYYGAADERIGCASVNISELVTEILKSVGSK